MSKNNSRSRWHWRTQFLARFISSASILSPKNAASKSLSRLSPIAMCLRPLPRPLLSSSTRRASSCCMLLYLSCPLRLPHWFRVIVLNQIKVLHYIVPTMLILSILFLRNLFPSLLPVLWEKLMPLFRSSREARVLLFPLLLNRIWLELIWALRKFYCMKTGQERKKREMKLVWSHKTRDSRSNKRNQRLLLQSHYKI